MKHLLLLMLLTFVTACGTNLPSHEESPYVKSESTTTTAQYGELKQRVLLLGDAGHSSLDPLQASLQKTIDRAAQHPDKTAVVMLGDNIYYFGFPNKEEGEQYSDSQLEDISHLEAQLEIAKRTGAEVFIVPGNHDWYASQVDSQAAFVEKYALDNQAKTVFAPHRLGEAPMPEVVHRNGISLFFIDSMWMIKADEAHYQMAMMQFNKLLDEASTNHPDNLLLVTAHHPIETMGPHNKYYTSTGYKAAISVLSMFGVNDQDTDHPNYRRLIDGMELTLARYPRAIYAAGHDHNLQVFKDGEGISPQYRLVSGAANTSKITGVGTNENSLFALAQEGLMELDIYDNGTVLRVFTINSDEAVFETELYKP